MKSLSARLLMAVSLLLLLFFGLAIAALETAFRHTAEQAIKDRLDVQMIMLISASDTDSNGNLVLPEQLPEARFMSPGSGLIGQVIAKYDELIWRSMSAVGVFLPVSPIATPGETSFQRAVASDGTEMFSYSLAVLWELSSGTSITYTFSVAESLQPYLDQVRQFRRQLFSLFGVLMVLLLASQAMVLRWVLQPLRQVEEEIADIETGDRTALSASFPSELQGLTQNTNRLINAERNRLSRYRNTLGNLAHSLKTPLAIVRNTLETNTLEPTAQQAIHEQIDRMNDIVSYQLQKAAASGGVTLGQRKIDVGEILGAVIGSLQKVYAGKQIECRYVPAEKVEYRAEKGDMMEILGNVLDNAFKWCRSRIDIDLHHLDGEGTSSSGLTLTVEDDGPGIAPGDVDRVLRRGQRADETVSGHGIGLSVVRELVELVDGRITIGTSALGGAKVTLVLPPR